MGVVSLMFLPVVALASDPTVSALRKLPDVVAVEARGNPLAGNAVIHLLDWHYVPEALFALDVQQLANGHLSKDDIAKLYEQHLRDVDAVQQEQMRVLRTLVRKHGLRTVFVEGVTDTTMSVFEARVAAFRELRPKEPLPKAAQLLLLELGAAGRLLIESETLRVVPLEDEVLLAAAKPLTKDGKLRFDAEKVRAREAEMAKRILAEDGAVIVICGGRHDFAGLLQGRRYLRIETKAYARLVQEH